MGFTVSANTASQRLGVSVSRVHQLIQSGVLPAQRCGGKWLIDDISIEVRASSPAKSGRPRRIEVESLQRYILMSRGHEVLELAYDPRNREFTDTREVFDAARAPVGCVSPRGSMASGDALTLWWRRRCVPHARRGIEGRLEELGLSREGQLPFTNSALSLSDQYWIKPAGSDARWEDVNLFDNEFLRPVAADWFAGIGLEHSPDSTSPGKLPKRWTMRDGRRILLKGGQGLYQEPYNEVVASALYRSLLSEGDYVPYTLVKVPDGSAASSCDAFVTAEEEFIPAWQVSRALTRPEHRSRYAHYIECCAKLGEPHAEDRLSKMLVCDDILANSGRSWSDFGLIRNVETLECRCAPLFDCGDSLWFDASLYQLERRDFRFASGPFRDTPKKQLHLVNDWDWLDIRKLEKFARQAENILVRNPALGRRSKLIAEGIRHRISQLALWV